jgi:SAM-dependent methyltransferase
MSALQGFRCTACGEPALVARSMDWDPGEVLAGAIACSGCGATFDVIWGTPFIGHYERDDIMGLIEIAANARGDNPCGSRRDVERLEGVLRSYHEARDRSAFLAKCSDDFAHAPWFENRYTEYSAFRSLARGIELADRDILDVGAGSGQDSWRLIQAGGSVTAVEYNPMLIRRGRSVVPEARWVGGFSHVLPFESETFDIVCCNAALHHMRDVPQTIREMLRVLRTGGWLVTLGDPFRADDSGEDTEFEVFDRHADVLLGVNESIPRFDDLVQSLVAYEDRLDVRLLTSVLYGMSEHRLSKRLFRFLKRSNEREWPLAAKERLAKTAGTLSMRAHVRMPLGLTGETQGRAALRSGAYADLLTDYDAAVAGLVPLLPSSFVDCAFPGERQTKFELLNGWQKPEHGRGFRTAYRRARWFLTRPAEGRALRFRVRSVEPDRVGGSLEVHAAGSPAATITLGSQWSETSVALDDVPPGERFVCELRVVLPDVTNAEFDDYCFAVKDRQFV